MKQSDPRGPIHMNLFHLGHSDESAIGGQKSNEGCPEGQFYWIGIISNITSIAIKAKNLMLPVLCSSVASYEVLCAYSYQYAKHIDSGMQKRLNSSGETINILCQLVSVLVTTWTDNGLLPVQHQAIIWTNADLQSIRPWGA